MKISEVILLAGLVVFSLVLLLSSLGIPYATEQTFGPGFVPLNLSVATLALIGIVVLKTVVATVKTKKKGRAAPEDVPRDTEVTTNAAARAGVLVAAIILVMLTAAAMEFVGVLPAVVVMMALISWRFSGHSPLKSVAVGVLSVAAIYVIFEMWLNIPLTS